MLWPPRGVFSFELFGRTASSDNAIALDGERLVVACHRIFDNPYFRTYHLEGANWIEDGRLLSGDRVPLAFPDGFGVSVDVDGDTVVAGWGPGALVFRRRRDHDWERTLVTRPPAAGEFGFGDFPDGIAIDGGWLVVATAWWGRQNSVYLFHLEQGTWVEKQRIPDRVVHAVALDGQNLLLGARDGVYAFELSQDAWNEIAALPYPAEPGASPFRIVYPRLAVAGDRSALLSTSYPSPSALHLFERTSLGWQHEIDLEAIACTSVALTEEHVFASSGFGAAGQVYAYARNAGHWERGPDLRAPAEIPRSIAFGRRCVASGSRLALMASDVFADNGQTNEIAYNLSSGTVYTYSLDERTRATLRASPAQMVIGLGGSHVLTLDAGPENAGKAFFLAGSLAGSSPGFQLRGLRIPLNRRGDPYFPSSKRVGRLDGMGRATVVVELPPFALDSELDFLRNRILHHAFLIWEPGKGITHVSNVALGALLGRIR